MSWPNSLKTVFVIDVIFVMARPSDIKLFARIPDFGELMKENKLVTYLESVGPITPVERATSRME